MVWQRDDARFWDEDLGFIQEYTKLPTREVKISVFCEDREYHFPIIQSRVVEGTNHVNRMVVYKIKSGKDSQQFFLDATEASGR